MNLNIFSVNICDCNVINILCADPMIVPNNIDDIVIMMDSVTNIKIIFVLLIPIDFKTPN